MNRTYAILPVIILLASCGKKEETTAQRTASAAPVAVQTVSVSQDEWPAVYEAVGTVRARTTLTISARTMGYVRELKVKTGDRVQAGQLLAELDARDMEAQIRQAEAARNEAHSAAAEVDSAAASAKANLELATVTFKRMEDLFQKKSISNQEFDEAAARLKVAQAGAGMALSKQQQVKAKIQQAEEAVQSASIQRGYAKIYAPFAGVVTEKRIEAGNLAAPGAPLLVIEQAGGYRLEAAVEESRLSSIKPGTPVTVVLDALQKSIPARVSEIVPAMDAATRAFTVKIDLPGIAQLQSGMFGRASFALGAKRTIAIPAGAVREEGQVASVLVAEDGVARTRLVTLGQRSGERIEVLSGLNAAEKIVFPRPAGLSDGARVEVRP
jgi:membrane fusion protein, multidrug efflux system